MDRADLPVLAGFFAEEGLLVTPLDGPAHLQVIHSRLGREHEPVRGTRLSAQIAAIDFPTENIAVVEGSHPGHGCASATSLEENRRRAVYLSIGANADRWKIARARLYRITEKNLALRDAHNERFPFLSTTESEARVIADSAKLSNRKPAAVQPPSSPDNSVAAEAVQRVAIGR
jgi:hypothetical protein